MTTPSPTRALASDIDPVRFEVIRNALLAITEEMGATLRRAAYSTNIKTRGDFSCAFFDRDLRTIAQAFAQPSHLGSLAHIVPKAIATYGAERLAPGDGILINDPYLGGVHLNDITLITPVFHEGTLFGYVANIAHHVDVGGGAPGSIGVSSEIYQEGLVIPPVRFVKDGQIDRDLFAMIRSNFRGTREISGDFRAQTAANRLGAQRIEALASQHGAPTLTHYLDELLRYLEANRDYLADYVRRHLPGVAMARPEGTYLAWLDCRRAGAAAADPYTFFLERAKVALNDGALFGRGGQGFVRLNFGSPRSLLTEGLERMRRALAG